ncbi:hypothetical protein BN1708_001355, partial [Verticillium longisporum]
DGSWWIGFSSALESEWYLYLTTCCITTPRAAFLTMGSLKRKEAPGGDIPSKKAKSSKDTRPAKSNKPSTSTRDGADSQKRASSGADAPKSVISSILKDEEPMFPRGGGSVLTPLEQKQIQLEAKADALREGEFDTEEKTKHKKEKRRKSKLGAFEDTKKKSSSDEDGTKIEALNYKRLAKGSVVLGQVSAISHHNLTIALPNNLSGNVSIAAISDVVTAKIQQAAEASDDDDDSADEGDDDDDIELNSLFEVGQYVRAYVLSTKEGEGSGKKNHIELSLRPEDANSGMSKNDVVANATVMAAVTSVQDHGYEMELGVDNKKLKGFLPKKDVGSEVDELRLQPGAVSLCLVKSVSGKIAQLCLDSEKLGKVDNIATEATTVNTFQPGTVVDVLVTSTTGRGLLGKILGHLPVTADLIHSGAGPDAVDLDAKYKIGSRVKARVICTFPNAKNPKLGISLLPHVVKLQAKKAGKGGQAKAPLNVLPIAARVDKCTVRKVEPEIGLYVDVGVAGLSGFVHISKVKDGKVEALYESSGPFKEGSVHRGRVIGYSTFDGMYLMTFEPTIIEQQFIRLEDVPAGEIVSCTIEKVVVGGQGVSGLVVKVAEGITGYVHETHFADVRLQHPEKKFREGMTVKARVLSVRPRKRQMRLTLKKTLVNSDTPIIKSFDEVEVGQQALGTISDISPHGARIEFYKGVRGWLPVSQMSEAFIQDPKEHFKVGQVVNVHILEVDPENQKLLVSCKDPSAFGLDKQAALKALSVGSIVSGKVIQKSDDDVHVELDGSNLKAILPLGQLTDKSANKSQSALKRIHMGQTLTDLLVLDKNERRRAITLSSKPSLVEAGKTGKLIRTYADAKVGAEVPGFISSIRPGAVLVRFGGNLVGVMFKTRLPIEDQEKEAFGLRKDQSITVRIRAIDLERTRLVVDPLTAELPSNEAKPKKEKESARPQAHGPFKKGETIRVRAIGLHDSKDHRFLAFSHRSYNSVLEFTAKASDIEADELKPLSLEYLQVGSTHVAFVNNASRNGLWTNISPVVRGRINAMDVSDDTSKMNDVINNFPIGTALKVRVIAVDAKRGVLDLSARSDSSAAVTWDSIKPNQVLAGCVVKVNERQIMMQVSELTKAREIAERAIKTINIREQTEKLNVWIAYLNLEVAYGTKTTVEEVFQRACQAS